MPKFNGETDKVLKVKLKSALLGARWADDHVSQAGVISLEVQTHFVADGSKVKVTVKDADGKAIETLNGTIGANCYRVRYGVTKPNKTGGMFFEAELPDHGLKGVSGKVAVLPPSKVSEPKWLDEDKKKEPEDLHPGQRYLLSAKVEAIPGKDDAVIQVDFLPTPDADPVSYRSLDAKVKAGKVEALWEIPADFRRPRNPSLGAEDTTPPPAGDEDPGFKFTVNYVGHSAASAVLPYIPSLFMHMIEVEDALFNHDSAVFLPSAPMGPGAVDGGPAPQNASRGTSGLGVVASLFRFVDRQSGKKLVIAGHTDTSGSESYNVTLSGKRADAVLAVIENDKDKWASLCQGQQKVQDFQQILSHYHDLMGWDCNPQGVDGELGENTKKALKGFRLRYNADKATLGFGSSPDLPEAALSGQNLKSEYWKAFLDLYQWELAQGLGTDIAGLGALRGKVQFVDAGKKTLAYGEWFPIQQPQRGNFRSQSNRRIEILLFDAGEEPDLAQAASSDATIRRDDPIYGRNRYLRNVIAPLWMLRFRVVDEDDDPVEVQRPLNYEVKDREGRVAQGGTFTGGTQILFFGDPLGRYFLYIESIEVGPISAANGSVANPLSNGEPQKALNVAALKPFELAEHGNIFVSISIPSKSNGNAITKIVLNGTPLDSVWKNKEGTLYFNPLDGKGNFSGHIEIDGQKFKIMPAGIVKDYQGITSSISAQFKLLEEAVSQRILEGKEQGESTDSLKFIAELAYSKALLALERSLDTLEKSGTAQGDPRPILATLAKSIDSGWTKVKNSLTGIG